MLLVEDDPLDVISVKRSLRKLEFDLDLHTAFNGIEALDFLQQKLCKDEALPEIILLDLNMPKMNGIEFLTELRKESRFDLIKIIVMTTSGVMPTEKSRSNLMFQIT